MARGLFSRHVRPQGRGALEMAYAVLQRDLARISSAGYSDHLELIRLSALAEGLLRQIQRLSTEMAEVRRELQEARTAPPQRDPYVEVLAAQVAELRSTVATQQEMLSEVNSQLLDVAGRLDHQESATRAEALRVERAQVESARVEDARAESERVEFARVESERAEAARVEAARAEAARLEALARPTAAPPNGSGAPGYPGTGEPARVGAGPEREDTVDLVGARSAQPLFASMSAMSAMSTGGRQSSSSGAPVSSGTPGSASDRDLDDETVLRLRLIRESFGD